MWFIEGEGWRRSANRRPKHCLHCELIVDVNDDHQYTAAEDLLITLPRGYQLEDFS